MVAPLAIPTGESNNIIVLIPKQKELRKIIFLESISKLFRDGFPGFYMVNENSDSR